MTSRYFTASPRNDGDVAALTKELRDANWKVRHYTETLEEWKAKEIDALAALNAYFKKPTIPS